MTKRIEVRLSEKDLIHLTSLMVCHGLNSPEEIRLFNVLMENLSTFKDFNGLEKDETHFTGES